MADPATKPKSDSLDALADELRELEQLCKVSRDLIRAIELLLLESQDLTRRAKAAEDSIHPDRKHHP